MDILARATVIERLTHAACEAEDSGLHRLAAMLASEVEVELQDLSRAEWEDDIPF